eukprot:TRINITY_DN11909_c1_g3_i1.p1 TRINITY_DN11909_c1_g3~~TRINITY_DN11909_c1_g3_i1.p1  ORF type:complete len:121 (-),score=22.79 TRINITY_DN11909_c1_g3_i1:51-413(-)
MAVESVKTDIEEDPHESDESDHESDSSWGVDIPEETMQYVNEFWDQEFQTAKSLAVQLADIFPFLEWSDWPDLVMNLGSHSAREAYEETVVIVCVWLQLTAMLSVLLMPWRGKHGTATMT